MEAKSMMDQARDIINLMSVAEMKTLHQFLTDEINYDFRKQQRIAACSFIEGQKVWFESTKYGRRIEGIITKVCQKNIKVKATDGMNWTVSATFLNKVV